MKTYSVLFLKVIIVLTICISASADVKYSCKYLLNPAKKVAQINLYNESHRLLHEPRLTAKTISKHILEKYAEINSLIDINKFNKQGYEILNGNELHDMQKYTFKNAIYDDSSFVGFLKVIKADYVYHWTSEEWNVYHKENNITKATMNHFFKQLNQRYGQQAYGPGFYVSLNDFNSKHYGTHLSKFRLSKPLVLLQLGGNNYESARAERKRYSAIGIDGGQIHSSWLTIYNDKVLQYTD